MAIASIRANQYFSFKRLYITQVPFVIRGPMGLHATVDEVKVRMLETPGVPPGISPDEISWDTLSFKIPPMGVEYFAQINPPLLDQLTEHSVGVINQLQLKLPEIVKLSFTDYRTQNETVEDPLITDYTAFLETMLGGNMNPRRNHLVKNAGDAVLI